MSGVRPDDTDTGTGISTGTGTGNQGTPAPLPDLPRAHGGVRIRRVPSKPVRRDGDGSLIVALWLQRDGTFDVDLDLRLSPAEAEVLHAQLCYALDDVPVATPPDATPDCRKRVIGGGKAIT